MNIPLAPADGLIVPSVSNPLPLFLWMIWLKQQIPPVQRDLSTSTPALQLASTINPLQQVIAKFTLNPKQTLAVTIACNHLQQLLGGNPPQQLLMIVLGEPGVGKSVVATAISHYFELVGQSHKLAIAAFTGVCMCLCCVFFLFVNVDNCERKGCNTHRREYTAFHAGDEGVWRYRNHKTNDRQCYSKPASKVGSTRVPSHWRDFDGFFRVHHCHQQASWNCEIETCVSLSLLCVCVCVCVCVCGLF